MLIHYLESIRPRTLTLAFANTLTGSALAYSHGNFRWTILLLATTTAMLLQMVTNLANDYGDFKNGKDTKERIGPRRMVQSGFITPQAMIKMIVMVTILTVLSGLTLLYVSFKHFTIQESIHPLIVFIGLGALAIVAAIKYTVGKNPYGYRALGDVMVFIFFGLIGVLGTYFLHTGTFSWIVVLPAVSIGLMSVAVLNLNNMRDYESDKKLLKRTMVVVMGLNRAQRYHVTLLIVALTLATFYTFMEYKHAWQWLYLASFPFFYRNIKIVLTTPTPQVLLPELKHLSMAILLFSLLFSAGLMI